jgi:hypothetical protein
MGWGRGRGGRGRRNWLYATGMPGWAPYGVPQVTAEQELEALKSQAQYMEESLNDIRKRMAEVEAEAKKKQ